MSCTFRIVTPVREGWPRVRASVASVAAQRESGVTVRHVVQLHAGSRDASADWLARQPEVILRIEDDAGLYDAIARGFRDGDEPYLGWLNADEQVLPGVLARAAGLFEANPDVDLWFGDYLLLDPQGRLCAARREIPARPWLLRHGVNSILSCATLFRRSLWERLDGFSPRYQRLADKEFYLRALASGAHFRHVSEYWGVFGLTGENRSRDALALQEQARLRAEAGTDAQKAARWFSRVARCIEKALRGAYGRHSVSVELFDDQGVRRPVWAVVGSRWKWS